jgi:hypothetical protein
MRRAGVARMLFARAVAGLSKGPSPDAARGTVRQEEFQHWVSGEFDTWQDRVTGANAAVQILLPLAAVAFGMTAFGFVLHFTAPGV